MASQKEFKTTKYMSYSGWRKGLKNCEALYNLPDEAKAPALFLTLSRQNRDAALEIPVEETLEKKILTNYWKS